MTCLKDQKSAIRSWKHGCHTWAIFFCTVYCFGACVAAQDTVWTLYEGTPPYSEGIQSEEVWKDGRVSNVQIPQLYIYNVPKDVEKTGAAVIYCPGGGYKRLAMPNYSKGYGGYFAQQGITAFILKYRLPGSKDLVSPHKVPITDALTALKLIRSKADELGIDPDNIGIMGGSAGGHLASMASNIKSTEAYQIPEGLKTINHHPNFTILVYPVISMDTTIAHMGSRRNLIGQHPDSSVVAAYSTELLVSHDSPPTFIVHGQNDASVPVANGMRYFNAANEKDVICEIHIFADGRHGAGMGKKGEPWSAWPELLSNWLEKYVTHKKS